MGLPPGPGLAPQLVHQDRPRAGEGMQGPRLASGSVEGEHQLAPSPLQKRFVTNHRLQFGDQTTCIACGQPRVDPVLLGRTAELLEALSLRRPESRVPVPLVSRASPQSERLVERSGGILGVARIEEPAPPLVGEPLEPERVHFGCLDIEQVTTAAGRDEIVRRTHGTSRFEGSTEPRYVRTQRLLRRPRRLLTPHFLDEVVDRHDVTRVRDQIREDRSFLRPGERQLLATFPDTSSGPRTRKRMRRG